MKKDTIFYLLRRTGINNAEIFRVLHRHPATISRAIKRNTGKKDYRPKQAHLFAHHKIIAKATGADIFFADPYSSCQRGTNENTNGLIRQFFPKNMQLDRVTKSQIDWVENMLNNRPRKILGYLTPNEVLSRSYVVALRS